VALLAALVSAWLVLQFSEIAVTCRWPKPFIMQPLPPYEGEL
jgi:hypothetical protein